jgi:hypothetical protein
VSSGCRRNNDFATERDETEPMKVLEGKRCREYCCLEIESSVKKTAGRGSVWNAPMGN